MFSASLPGGSRAQLCVAPSHRLKDWHFQQPTLRGVVSLCGAARACVGAGTQAGETAESETGRVIPTGSAPRKGGASRWRMDVRA